MRRILKTLGIVAGLTVVVTACAIPKAKQPDPVLAAPAPVTPKVDYLQMGDAHMQQGRMLEALSIYREGLKEDPKSPLLHERAAIILDQLGRNDEAMDTYAEALRLAPDNERTHLAVAHLMYRTENYPTAVVHFKQVERVNPLNASAYRWAAMCFIKMDRWEDAQKEIEAEAKIRPGDPETMRTLQSIRQSVARRRAAVGMNDPFALPLIPPPSEAIRLGVVTPKGDERGGAAPPPQEPAGQPAVSVFEIPDPPKAPAGNVD